MKILVPYLGKEDLAVAGEALMRRTVEAWTKMNFSRDDITFILVRLHPLYK